MKKALLAVLLMASSSATFAAPQNYTLDCGLKKTTMIFTGQGFNDMLVMGTEKGDVIDYLATFNLSKGDGSNAETMSPVVNGNLDKEGRIQYVKSSGAVEVLYAGDGISRVYHIIDDNGNHACKTIGYDQKQVKD